MAKIMEVKIMQKNAFTLQFSLCGTARARASEKFIGSSYTREQQQSRDSVCSGVEQSVIVLRFITFRFSPLHKETKIARRKFRAFSLECSRVILGNFLLAALLER
jgi:hypothetical protein